MHCAALAGNPRGDPVDRPCAVYLPEGYESGARRYPVVVLLHAFMGSVPGWFNTSPFSPGIVDRLDALFASGAPPFLTVFPDGLTGLGGSQWIDSPGNRRMSCHEPYPPELRPATARAPGDLSVEYVRST